MTEPEGRGWLQRYRVPGLAVLLIGGLYLPFLGVPFEYDDKVEIVFNQVLRHPGDVQEMWNYNPFRVLLLYTFAADIWAWGLVRPEGYRAVNIAVHALNSVLLWWLLSQLLVRRRAVEKQRGTSTRDQTKPDTASQLGIAAGTLLFAVHPLAIESVTYVSGRSSSLATTFVLLSTVSYVALRTRSPSPRIQNWFGDLVGLLNRASGAALAAALLVGVPCGLLFRSGELSATRALLFPVVAAATGLVLAWLRWGASSDLFTPEPDESGDRKAAVSLWLLSFSSFVLGCLTKEIAATLPALLLLLEVHWFCGDWRSGLRQIRGRLFPFFAIPAALVGLRAVTYGYIASPVFVRPWTDNLATQIEVFWNYVRLWVVPYPQSIYHDYPVVEAPGTPLTWLALAGLLGLILFALRSGSRRAALAFGILALVGTLSPTTSVFALKETMVEHRTYLPSIGYAFVAAWVVQAAVRRFSARLVTAALLAWISAYATLNLSYNLLWRSEEVLWAQATVVNPHASDAWRNLGDLYRGQGRMTEAQDVYAEAVQAKGTNIEALTSLAMLRGMAGDLPEADSLLQRALQVDGCHGPALNNLAMVMQRRSDWDRAVDLYDRALTCDPEDVMANLGLGHLYFGPLGSRKKAAEHYQRFLEIADPLHPAAAATKARLMELSR